MDMHTIFFNLNLIKLKGTLPSGRCRVHRSSSQGYPDCGASLFLWHTGREKGKLKHLVTSQCKNCIKNARREYRKANIEKFKLRDKLYQRAHRPYIREYLRKYQVNRKKTDPAFLISCRLRWRLLTAVKQQYKKSSITDLLGCSIPEFLGYFISLFTDDMIMEDFMTGRVHIDHIKPCSSFDLRNKKDQMECFHYTNLQPLWDIDNLRKGSSWEVCHQ